MSLNDLAAEIFARVIADRILGNPKVWEIPEKQARGIARAALAAAGVFAGVSQEAPPPFKPVETNPLGPPLDE